MVVTIRGKSPVLPLRQRVTTTTATTTSTTTTTNYNNNNSNSNSNSNHVRTTPCAMYLIPYATYRTRLGSASSTCVCPFALSHT